VINSEKAGRTLRELYLNNTRDNVKEGSRVDYEGATGKSPNTEPPTTESPPTYATLNIWFGDIFIEGEYITVRSK
jgi:hypothetical protein